MQRNNPVQIRVSEIATLSWCQKKALLLMQKKISIKENVDTIIGRHLHNHYGFAMEIEVSRMFGDIEVIGHLDAMDATTVYEFKATRKGYPLRFLLSYAHRQANIYAYLFKKKYYEILVYNRKTGKILHISERADWHKARSDIMMAIGLLKGYLKPIKTNERWKCEHCEAKEICQA